MKRRAGVTLMEMLLYIVIFALLLNLVAFAFERLHRTHRRVTMALGDLQVAERFLGDVKADLRRARAVLAEPGRLALWFEGGEEAVYEVRPEEGCFRSGTGDPAREYRDAFGAVTFAAGPGGAVVVDVELRKQDSESPYHARWRSIVACPNLEK